MAKRSSIESSAYSQLLSSSTISLKRGLTPLSHTYKAIERRRRSIQSSNSEYISWHRDKSKRQHDSGTQLGKYSSHHDTMGDGEERRRRYTRSIVDNESNSINFRLS